MTDTDKVMNPHHFGRDPAVSGYGLIQQFGLESLITFGRNVAGKGLSTLIFVAVVYTTCSGMF